MLVDCMPARFRRSEVLVSLLISGLIAWTVTVFEPIKSAALNWDALSIDWTENRGWGLVEAVAWLSAFGFALASPRWTTRRTLQLVALTTALQLASLAGHVRDNAPFAEKSLLSARSATSHYTASRFSSDRNVLVIVLDAFQSDFFSQAMVDEDLRAAMPPGFTFYRNAVSLYPSTQLSLQSILTSRTAPARTDTIPWAREAMRNSIPAVLGKHGFDAILSSFSLADSRVAPDSFVGWAGHRRRKGGAAVPREAHRATSRTACL